MGLPGRPTLVLLFDGSHDAHLRAIRALESDDRLKAAAHFFRCLRIDTRGSETEDLSDIRLRAYSPDGQFVGEQRGPARIPNALSLLERAFEHAFDTPAGEPINWVANSLTLQRGAHEALAAAEQQIVCAHCGNCEPHIRRLVDALRADAQEHDEALAAGLELFRR